MDKIKELGFQVIYSRHVTTNSAIIIPKLKAGFVISAMELSDKFGVSVPFFGYPTQLNKTPVEIYYQDEYNKSQRLQTLWLISKF